ncbi:MAG: transposase [Alphaproteobacteria bacterium]|nr:transposase [Alphaproteobacteria bacterium]
MEDVYAGKAAVIGLPAAPQDVPVCDARIDILNRSTKFRKQYLGTLAQADKVFCEMYNSGQADFECIQYDEIKSISVVTLKRWRRDLTNGGYSSLANKPSGRTGTGFFETALGGKIKTQIGAYYLQRPHISIPQIYRHLELDFGLEFEDKGKLVKLPHIRTLERWYVSFMAEYKNAFMMVVDPDGYKNSIRLVGNNMNSHVTHFNQKWEVDASPTDILTTDGRYTLYALIDVYSRSLIIYISKTPKSEAVLALLRAAMIRWGVPEEIATDNGSDFVSAQCQKALEGLEITLHRCGAYSPEQKGTVERVIKTINHGLMTMVPGYIGHSVADRKKIEARKSFAQRLGAKDDDVFCIETSPEKLQEYCSNWADFTYGRDEHESLGISPFEKMQSCDHPVKKIRDIRALDLLLAPIAAGGGYRTVTKQGVRIEREFYWSSELEVGTRVMVRHNPDDLGIVYLFSEDGAEFICEAVCPTLRGIDPKEMIKAKRTHQREQHNRLLKEMKSASRKMKQSDLVEGIIANDIAKAQDVISFPKVETDYSSEGLKLAGDALEGYVPVKDHGVESNIVKLPKVEKPDVKRQRLYKKCNVILADIEADKPVTDSDRKWAARYVKHADYISEKNLEEYFAMANGD